MRYSSNNLIYVGHSTLLEFSRYSCPKHRKRNDGNWAIITVRNEGPGIAPELIPRLFTRLAAGPRSPSLGLGLFLARNIAEVHGVTLTVDSKPGQGTCFRLALPLQ